MKVSTAFTKHNPKLKKYRLVEEDFFKYFQDDKKIIISAADGITRDPEGLDTIPDIEEERIKIAQKYPNPSPARQAAELFCNTFISFLHTQEINNEDIIKKAFDYSNQEIYKKLNKSLDVNYLDRDYAGCVASGGIIQNGMLFCGFITDCGVCIFDKKGNLKFRTNDESPNKDIGKILQEKYKTSFKYSKGRRIIRSIYRNNLQEPLAYGALTGEAAAINYVRTSSLKLEKDDSVIFYTDGMKTILFSKELKNFNNLEKFVESNLNKIDGAEGTLILVR